MFLAYALSAAHASQSAPVDELEGEWALTCTQAELSVHLGLAGTFGGVPGAIDDAFVLPIDCHLSRGELWELSSEVYHACRDGGFDPDTCRDLTGDVRKAVKELSEKISPDAFTFGISESDPFGILFGLYPATGVLAWDDGTEEVWSYVVDNNDGTRGEYGTLGIALDMDSDTTLGLGCLAAGIATATGNIAPDLGTVTWGLDAAATLVCAADLGSGNWIGGDVTVGIAVDAEGERL